MFFLNHPPSLPHSDHQGSAQHIMISDCNSVRRNTFVVGSDRMTPPLHHQTERMSHGPSQSIKKQTWSTQQCQIAHRNSVRRMTE
jgi:hypothetical protein